MSERKDRRRVQVWAIGRRHMLDIFAGRAVIENVPEDAEVVAGQWDVASDGVELLIQSETFDPVPEYQKAPWRPVMLRVVEQRARAIRTREEDLPPLYATEVTP